MLVIVVPAPGLAPGAAVEAGRAASSGSPVSGLRTVDRAAPGEAFRIDVDWELPEDATPGDTFRLELPDSLRTLESSFDVKDPDGDVIARAAADADGLVFTLTEYVEDHANVFGVIHFGVEITEDAQPGGFAEIGWGDGRTTSVEIMPPTDEGWTNDRNKGQKYGEYYPETEVVEWIVMGPLGHDTVAFEDAAKDGQTFLCGQMRVEIWNLDVGGHWDSSVLAQNHDVACDEGRVQGEIRDVPRGKIGALIIPTRVPEDESEVENTATISVEGRTDQPTAAATVTSSGGQGVGDLLEGAADEGELGEDTSSGIAEWDGEPQAEGPWHQRLWSDVPLVVGVGLLVLLAGLAVTVMVRRRQ